MTGRPVLELEELDPARPEVVERLWQLYRHDLSEFRNSLPDEHGLFKVIRLALFLEPHPGRRGYVFRRAGLPVGFALVAGVAAEPHHMVEFLVVRAVRRHGVARDAARQLFAGHPGTWEIGFQEANAGAARFWRELAGGGAREELRPVPGKPHIPPDAFLTATF